MPKLKYSNPSFVDTYHIYTRCIQLCLLNPLFWDGGFLFGHAKNSAVKRIRRGSELL